MTKPTLPERLLDTANNIHSRGAGIAEKMLREAADAITQHRGQLDAYREHCHALGQHLSEAHKPGEVDPEAVAILDGYHVGAREVAGGGQGEPGETTLEAALRLLRLAHDRGAFQEPAKARENRVAALARLQEAVDAPASYATLLGAAEEAARALRVPLLIAAMQDKDVAELQRLRAERAVQQPVRLPDLTPEQEAAIDLFLPQVEVVAMQKAGQWQVHFRACIENGLIVDAPTEQSAERAGALELAARAYPSIFPRPQT